MQKLQPPPDEIGVDRLESEVPAAPVGRFAGEMRRRHRKPFTWGIVVSVLAHVVLIVLYGNNATLFVPEIVFDRPPEEATTDFSGVRLIPLVEVTDLDAGAPIPSPAPPDEVADAAPETAVPETEAPTSEPAAPVAVPSPAIPVPVADPISDEDARTAAEDLRIDAADPQGDIELWRPVAPDIMAVQDEDLILLILAMDLVEWADSMALIAESERAVSDWTFTDDDGKKWGIADGQLYLGGVSIPLPFGFGSNPYRRDDAVRRAFEDEAIRRGVRSQAIRRVVEERSKIMRARIDRERAARRRARGDTIRGGGRD